MFLFMCTATLFGALVSQLNEIVATTTHATKELDPNLESYTYIKPKSPVPPPPLPPAKLLLSCIEF